MKQNNDTGWRRLKARCQASSDLEERKQILLDATHSIEIDSGPSSPDLLYPYLQLYSIFHESGNREVAGLYLKKHYLVSELNYFDEPDILLDRIESMQRAGYLFEAVLACNSLIYLMYESISVDKGTLNQVLWTLKKLNDQYPERTARKLIAYARFTRR